MGNQDKNVKKVLTNDDEKKGGRKNIDVRYGLEAIRS